MSFAIKILVSYSVAALLLIGSLTVFGLKQADGQDRTEIRYTEKAVTAAITAKQTNFRSWLKGYALWDDIYIHMALDNDAHWADRNLGKLVWKTFTLPMTGVFISDESERVHFAYWGTERAASPRDIKGVDFPALRAAADKTDTPVVVTILYGGQPHFMGVARLRPVTASLASPTDPKRYLVWLEPLSGQILSDIGTSLTIPALRWEPHPDLRTMPAVDLFSDPGISGRVTWTPRHPGTAMLRQAALPACALLLVTVLVGLAQYLMARRLNLLLAERQKQAEEEAENSRRATAQAATAERDAQALMLRVTEHKGTVDRLSEERDREREQRKDQARTQSLATLSMFEQDIDTALHPILDIAELLKTRAGELEQEAEAGRRSAAMVLDASHRSTEAIDIVVTGNASLSQATARLDDNVSEAVASTRRAEQTIDDLIRRLADLNANAIAAEEVVATVADVATRINMLALNARIEAARAGESGRGFAIVAEEVRQMAELARNSAQIIASTLQAMQDNTQTATSGINFVGRIVGEIADVTASSRSALDHQSVVAGQIMDAIASAKDRVSSTDTAMHELNQAVASSERMARALSSMAGDLGQQSNQLQAKAGQFARALRAEGRD